MTKGRPRVPLRVLREQHPAPQDLFLLAEIDARRPAPRVLLKPVGRPLDRPVPHPRKPQEAAAAVRATPELCDLLQQDVDDLATAPRGPSFADFRRYWEADERFHRRIAEHSGNKYLLRSYSALGGQVLRYRLFVGHGVTDAEPTLHEHGLVLAAIRAGDADGARSSMDRHIAGVWERARKESAEETTGESAEESSS